MMTAATGNTSRALHHGVAQLVASFLSDSGLPAHPKPYVPRSARISDGIAADLVNGPDGDVRGLDGLYMNVTSRQSFRPWEDLDRARVGADITGRPVGLFCQWRSGRSVGDSIVVLSLADFAKLVGGTPPTL